MPPKPVWLCAEVTESPVATTTSLPGPPTSAGSSHQIRSSPAPVRMFAGAPGPTMGGQPPAGAGLDGLGPGLPDCPPERLGDGDADPLGDGLADLLADGE